MKPTCSMKFLRVMSSGAWSVDVGGDVSDMRRSVPREIDEPQELHARGTATPLVECEPDPGVKVKEGMRPTSMALAVGAMVALAFAGCSQKFGELIYNDSLLCGDLNQACAPDGGRFDLHIVDRTSYVVATPSVPTFDMVIKPNS